MPKNNPPNQSLDNDQAVENTDTELWREPRIDEDGTEVTDYYSNNVFVTKTNGLGINVGGYVIVMPLKEWRKVAESFNETLPSKDGQGVSEDTMSKGSLNNRIEEILDTLVDEVRGDYSSAYGPIGDYHPDVAATAIESLIRQETIREMESLVPPGEVIPYTEKQDKFGLGAANIAQRITDRISALREGKE